MVLRVELGLSEDLHEVLDLPDLVEFVAEVLGLEFHQQRPVRHVVLDLGLLAFPEFLVDHQLLPDALHVLLALGLQSRLVVHKGRRTLDSLREPFGLVVAFHLFSGLQLLLVQFELQFLPPFLLGRVGLQRGRRVDGRLLQRVDLLLVASGVEGHQLLLSVVGHVHVVLQLHVFLRGTEVEGFGLRHRPGSSLLFQGSLEVVLQRLEVGHISGWGRSEREVKVEVVLSRALDEPLSLHLLVLSHSGRQSGHSVAQLGVVLDSQLSFLRIVFHHSLEQIRLAVPRNRIGFELAAVLHHFQIGDKVFLSFVVLHISLVKAERLFICSSHSL